MITDNLSNAVYFSRQLPSTCPVLSQSIADVLKSHGVPYAFLSGTKDIWCRDFMPIQVEEDRFVFYQYTPNYLRDALHLQTNTEEVFRSGENHLQHLLQNTVAMDLVMDGGNVVKCGDTVVMTEKVFVENKAKTRSEVERILKDAFQCDLLFLPWDHQEKFGHSDGIVHYAGDGKVLLTNYDDISPYYYNRFRKALEKRFEVIPLRYQTKRPHARSWAYINFLQIGKLVLVPQLGLEEDEQALEQIGNALPDCEVIGIPALESVRKGGALNCISWNIKEKKFEMTIEETMVLAEQGDVDAQYNLALYYQYGRGVEQNSKKAVEWYTRAAEQGDSWAQTNLGHCYYYGDGVRKNYKKAVEWFVKAAEQGADKAQFLLAECYREGNGVKRDPKMAVCWYTKASEQGNAMAQYYLAYCFEHGLGVKTDMESAVVWYRKAAEQGYEEAQFNLAICYERGEGIEEDPKMAVKWYVKAAKQGFPLAQYNLAICYEEGIGTRKNRKKAVAWYSEAAAQGVIQAYNNLGWCYEHGHGVKKDLSKAFEWYSKGVEFGDETAQFSLALCYHFGKGVEPDHEKAVELYTRLAVKGDAKAQNNLAECYKEGLGVLKNLLTARHWYTQAARQGDPLAKESLRELQKQLSFLDKY